LILGPGTCASPEWILEQVELHDRHGTIIAGSLIASDE
jgi:hypothetical protein